MPSVLRMGPFRFFFFAGDRDEPMHVHGERDKALAKYRLSPVRMHHSVLIRLVPKPTTCSGP
jgi:hypothetical protein